MKELFRVGSNCVMLQTPGSHEVFTLNGRPDSQKEAVKLTGVQHFGFRLCEKADMKKLLKKIEKAGGNLSTMVPEAKTPKKFRHSLMIPIDIKLKFFGFLMLDAFGLPRFTQTQNFSQSFI